MEKITAVILSAGKSSRMRCGFKPLLPLGNRTVLAHVIQSYRDAGIEDICVVTGHRGEALKPVIKDFHVCAVENPEYEQGMFSSVQAGLQALDAGIRGVFVHPVDIPLVRPATLKKMGAVFHNNSNRILMPVYQDRCGHPPLIAGGFIRLILAWTGENGLQGALSQLQNKMTTVETADEGILSDMDRDEDYRRIVKRFWGLDIPTQEECREVMDRIAVASQKVRKHGQAVCRMALLLSEALNRHGCSLNTDLVAASALLHDVARGQPNHARIGAELLRQMGFYRPADIVALHMDFSKKIAEEVDEAAVVFLADKLICDDRPVDPDRRFKAKIQRYAHDSQAITAIRSRQTQTMNIKQAVENIINMPLEKWIAVRYEPCR
ncbi:MAG: NTP transferase domain-containing protein [Deltaproteobacteria bacterium]|nr:NTP transferase domain-containing protein [Deltaproteobacteria bacterium]